MKILKLPKKFISISSPESNPGIISLDNAWMFNAFENNTSLWFNANCSVCLLNCEEIKTVAKKSYISLSLANSLIVVNVSDNTRRKISLRGEIQKYDKIEDLHKLQEFLNKDYQCFVVNPFIATKNQKPSHISYLECLLTFSGLNSEEKSFLIIYNEKERKAMSFESPLTEPLLSACASRDGLTFLMLSENYAAIIDNPML